MSSIGVVIVSLFVGGMTCLLAAAIIVVIQEVGKRKEYKKHIIHIEAAMDRLSEKKKVDQQFWAIIDDEYPDDSDFEESEFRNER